MYFYYNVIYLPYVLLTIKNVHTFKFITYKNNSAVYEYVNFMIVNASMKFGPEYYQYNTHPKTVTSKNCKMNEEPSIMIDEKACTIQ